MGAFLSASFPIKVYAQSANLSGDKELLENFPLGHNVSLVLEPPGDSSSPFLTTQDGPAQLLTLSSFAHFLAGRYILIAYQRDGRIRERVQ